MIKRGRNILNFLALNRLVARDPDFAAGRSVVFQGASVLNISNETCISFFRRMKEAGVNFLVTGGMAAAFYGHLQPVKELEIWLKNEETNKSNFCRLLNIEKFDIPASMVINEPSTGESFTLVVTDTVRHLMGLDFDDCNSKREQALLEGVLVPILDLDHLIAGKVASGRKEEQSAIQMLKRIRRVTGEKI